MTTDGAPQTLLVEGNRTNSKHKLIFYHLVALSTNLHVDLFEVRWSIFIKCRFEVRWRISAVD